MGHLIVITTPDLAPGFQLAGIKTYAVETVAEAETQLTALLAEKEASLIVVRRALLHAMSPRLQRQVETSTQPVVMQIAGRQVETPGQEHQRHISDLIRRTVGFHIEFGTRQPREAG